MKVTEFNDPYVMCVQIAQEKRMGALLEQLEQKKKEIGLIAHGVPFLTRLEVRDGLQELTALGLVSTIIHKNVKPMQIEYALTNRGAKYQRCLRTMRQVGVEIMQEYGMEETLIQGGYLKRDTPDTAKVQQ